MNLSELQILTSTILGIKAPQINVTIEQWTLLLHLAQLKHYKRKVGLPEQYQPGQPLPAQVVEITSRITDDISPFKMFVGRPGETQFVIDSNGEAAFPADYFYPLSFLYLLPRSGTVEPREVDIVTDAGWTNRRASQIIAPTKRYPIVNVQDGYFRFFPKNLQMVEFTYLRIPNRPVYGFTTTQSYNKYNSATSTQLEWDEPNQMDILHILLADLGVVSEKGEILQIAEKIKTQGI